MTLHSQWDAAEGGNKKTKQRKLRDKGEGLFFISFKESYYLFLSLTPPSNIFKVFL